MAQHIYSSTSDPASAPAAIGHHWVNTSSGDTWIATGTSSAADWKKVNNAVDTGITTLNGLTADPQTFATGTSGSDFNISSATSTHTFNIPTASGSNRGLLSTTDWTTFNNKQDAGNYIDGLSGDVTASGPGTVAATIATNAVTDSKFRQSSGVSIVGRSANSTGNVADITASSDGQFLARASNALSFVTPASTDISDFTEATQDAVGAMISSSDFQYTDSTPLLSAKKTVEIKVLDDSTTLTTGDGKYIWVVPSQFNNRIIIGVFATITTVSSSGTPTIQIRNITDSVDVLSTAITIDVSEYTSDTAATPAVINTSNDDLATGDRIAIDVDTAGTGAKGLSVGIIIGV